MASKKVHCGKSSFLMSKNEEKQREKALENTANTFVNDGSFLELYKKRMEAVEKPQTLSKDSAPSGSDGEKTEKDSKTTDKTLDPQDDSRTVKTSSLSQGKRKLMVGRMGGASKQFHAKKKKQEKQAEQEKNKDKGENSSWNAYMEEVKKYREGSCTEEVDRVRPLVK